MRNISQSTMRVIGFILIHMAFYLSTKGQLHPYHFKYLEGVMSTYRFDKTAIHSELPSATSHLIPKAHVHKEFYALDIMSKNVTTSTIEIPLSSIRDEMKKRDIRHIPIVNDSKIVGIISDRDLLKVEASDSFNDLKAESVMSSILILAEDNTPLSHVAQVLINEKISSIPIIDQSQNLVGIISRTDVLKAIVSNRLVLIQAED